MMPPPQSSDIKSSVLTYLISKELVCLATINHDICNFSGVGITPTYLESGDFACILNDICYPAFLVLDPP
jgi:hypothetical protein